MGLLVRRGQVFAGLLLDPRLQALWVADLLASLLKVRRVDKGDEKVGCGLVRLGRAPTASFSANQRSTGTRRAGGA